MADLIKSFSKHDGQKRQATGTDEEISQFEEDMQEIKMRHESKSRVKEVADKAKRSLYQLEEEGVQIRDSAMKSLLKTTTKRRKRELTTSSASPESNFQGIIYFTSSSLFSVSFTLLNILI